MTEARIAVSPTGGRKGRKDAELGNVDPKALLVLAEVAGKGAEKYGDPYNFLKGYDWSLSFNAMQRHALAFWSGEDTDPESGLPHMGHVAWHALALVSFLTRGLGTDDRFKQGGRVGIDPALSGPGPNMIIGDFVKAFEQPLIVGKKYRVADDAVHYLADGTTRTSFVRGVTVTLVHTVPPEDPTWGDYSDANAVVEDGTGLRVVGREFLTPVRRPVHNHDYDPTCTERVVDGHLRGECMTP